MNTYTKSLLAAAATFFVTFAALAEEPVAKAPTKKSFAVGVFASKDAQKVNLTIENYANKALTITLKDENGSVIYTEAVQKGIANYWRKFDMSQVEANACSFTVSDGKESISKGLNTTERSIEANIQPTELQDLAVGMYQIENTMKMSLAVHNKTSKAVTISLKNAEGEEIYNEIVGKSYSSYKRAFDLAGLADGTYRFEISNGANSITKEVSINTQK
jgi:hypothetical protein